MRRLRRLRMLTKAILLAAASATLAGCMQMSYVVRLNEDGSGKVTEVVKFGPKVIRLEKKLPKGEGKRLADLADARVRVEVVVVQEPLPEVGPAVDLVDTEKMTPEELERLRDQFLKDRKPEAICKRIEENEAIPPSVRKRLVATLRGGELDKKYEMLLSAYFLELARQGK